MTEQEDGRKRVRGLLEEAVDSLAITGAQAVGHAVTLPDLDGLLGTVGVERLGTGLGAGAARSGFPCGKIDFLALMYINTVFFFLAGLKVRNLKRCETNMPERIEISENR